MNGTNGLHTVGEILETLYPRIVERIKQKA